MIERTAYAILIGVFIAWLVLIIAGLIDSLPEGTIGLCAIVAIGLLFIKILRERLANKEDEYYSKNVKK